MEDKYGNRKGALPQSAACTFRAVVQFERAVDDPSFAVAFVNPQRQNVFVASTATRSEATGRFDGGETATFSVSFDNALAPGRYALSTLVSRPGGGIIDRFESIFTIVVTGARAAGGIVDLAHDVHLERAPSPRMARGAS